MERYIALLRGVNISGKNKIAMAELKAGFEGLGYRDVCTWLNSGNVVFSSDEADRGALSGAIQRMIQDKFALDIPVFILTQKALQDGLDHAPDWWGGADQAIYDNLIFLAPTLSYEAFRDAMGAPRAEYEQAHHYKDMVFWSFSRKDYQKTRWWSQTASASVSNQITIRTANTVRKIAGV